MTTMDYGTFGSLMTVVMLVVFLAIVAWAFSSRRSAAFDEAARVPLDDETTSREHDSPHGQD